jgi:hypothetical protein
MEKSFARRCRNLGPFVWAISFFALLWMLDFPKPFIDDLFNIGAALSMVGGGTFSNPLIIRQQFATNRYFPHPRTSPYVFPFDSACVFDWRSV